MLKKNVYLVYPAGFHGSYLKWAIEASDTDLQKTIVPNPVNLSNSKKLGGIGTAHLHFRIPTHQRFRDHQRWMIYNRPADKRVYVINDSTARQTFYEDITDLLFEDPDGIVILINDNNDHTIAAYGKINCVTKWPTMLDAHLALNKNIKMHSNFDSMNCKDDVDFRNFIVKHPKILMNSAPADVDRLKHTVKDLSDWYRVRHTSQPHEVNSDYYIETVDVDSRFLQISCQDIVSMEFLSFLNNLLSNYNICDSFDTHLVEAAHPSFIAAQPNLQWFESYKDWKNSGCLDNFLKSHSVIHALLIREMLDQSKVAVFTDYDNETWVKFYQHCQGPDWPDLQYFSEYDFYQLPEWVQKEIVDFGYNVKSSVNSQTMFLAGWEKMSLSDINDLFQKHTMNRL